MKVIVTGGAGFIGSHIVDAYIKAGHRVAVIDNLSTGFRKNLNPKARFYKADIRNAKLMEKILRKERPEIVNHQAAKASVIESIRNPAITLETNVLGTANLFSAFAKYGLPAQAGPAKRKFIFASTGGAIYGSPKKLPAAENTPPDPLSPYALSKLLAEETVKFYSRDAGIPYLILRYSNVYGPRQNPKGEAGVVAIFSRQMSRGERPTIFGDGSKTRDYVYVGDVVQANVLGLKRGANEIVNIGRGKEIRDDEVFREVAKALDFRKQPIYAPFRSGEVRRISLNARRAKRILGWTPKTPFAKGIKKTVAATTL